MRKLFKTLILILITILATGLSYSCSSTSDDSEEFIATHEYEIKDLKPINLSFCFPGVQPKNWPAVRAEIEKRISNTINVSLDFEWSEYRSYIQEIQVLSASDEILDVYCLGQPRQNYPDFTTLAREGQLKDISKLFPEYAPNLYQKYSEQELDYARVDGKLYAVPSLFPNGYCTYVMINDVLCRKLGIKSISNWDEYEAFLRSVSNQNNDMAPGTYSGIVDTLKLFSRGSGYVILDEPQKLVYKWSDPDMKVTAWEKTPEFKTAISYLISWFKKGYLKVEPDIQKTASFILYGMLVPPTEETHSITYNVGKVLKDSDPLRTFYLYPDRIVQRDNPMGSFYFNGSFVFNAKSENIGKALMFLDWVQKDSSNYLLVKYGIENKDYVLKEGYPVMPANMDFFNSSYMYWDGSWAFSNIDYEFAYHKTGEGDDKIFDPKAFFEKYTKYPPHGALYPDYKDLAEAAEKRARTFFDFENRLKNGRIKDLSEIGSLINELQGLGSDNIVKNAQEQLNKFKSK